MIKFLSADHFSFLHLPLFFLPCLWKFLGHGQELNPSHSFNARALTHCAGPGFKSAPPQGPEPLQLDIQPTALQWELLEFLFLAESEQSHYPTVSDIMLLIWKLRLISDTKQYKDIHGETQNV